MKKLFLTIGFALTAIPIMAQSNDPVIMTVAGKPITRAEFEYSFRKNGSVEGAVEKKTVEEYVPMFINYKLKVAAAEAAHLDTLSSFRKEFLTYRDMQLTPYMVDSAYIDSVAHVVFDNTLKQTGGKDLYAPAHILIQLSQKASETEKQQAQAKADSLCNALKAGADFADLAKRFSNDRQSASRGGQYPLIGPGAMPKEYEEAAYTLEVNEVSTPVLTDFGYFIIKVTERRPFKDYAEWKDEIVAMLKSRGIEEQSAEARIKKMVDDSQGQLTREAILDSVMNAHIDGNPSLRYLIQEYYDGLLLYEVSKRQVWDVAAADTVGLENWYKTHKKEYQWTEPRFKGYVIHAKNEATLKKATKLLKKSKGDSWRQVLKDDFNKDSLTVNVSGPYLCKQGENRYIDAHIFGVDKKLSPLRGLTISTAVGKKLSQPKSWEDVKTDVLNDYQSHMEKQWVEELRTRFPFTINQQEINKIKD